MKDWGTQNKIPFDDIIFNISVFVDMAVLIFQVFFLAYLQGIVFIKKGVFFGLL